MTTEFTKRELEILRYHNTEANIKAQSHLEGIRLLYGTDTKPDTLEIYGKYIQELLTIDNKISEIINKHDAR